MIALGILGAAEVVVRLLGVEPPVRPAIVARSIDIDIDFPFMRSDPELFWAPRPEFRGEFLGRAVSINRLGLRGPEIEIPKRRGRRRVACFGDSITFGYGVADDETYAHRLGGLLARRGVEVVNAGVTGYTTHQVLRLVERIIPTLDIDVATFLVGWNDASLRPVDDRTYARRIRASAALEGVVRHVHLFRAAKALYLRWLMRRAKREWDTPPTGQRVPVDHYRENLRAIVRECRSRGTRPVFLELPRRRRHGEVPSFPSHAAVLAEVSTAMGVPLVDLGELGRRASRSSNELYFIDSLHLSVEGHQLVAERLAQAVN